MFGTYRTLLALMVVAQHLGGIPAAGGYAVFGFYCLSGYLMTLIMQTNYGYTANGITKYAVNRFLRIYPIYWFSILVSIALILQLGNDFTSSFHPVMYMPTDFSDAMKNLLLIFPFMDTPRLTPPAWALTVEIFFYILIGFGISKNKRITLAWFIVSVIYHVGALILQVAVEYRYFTVFAASLPFSTGALIFHYRQRFADAVKHFSGAAYSQLPVLAFTAVLANCLLAILSGYADGIFFYSNYLLCALMVVVLYDRKTLPFITRRFDDWMGELSYPTYLIHFQVGILVVLLYSAAGIELTRPSMMLMAVSVPAVLVCAWVISVCLDRPIETIRAKVKQSRGAEPVFQRSKT